MARIRPGPAAPTAPAGMAFRRSLLPAGARRTTIPVRRPGSPRRTPWLSECLSMRRLVALFPLAAVSALGCNRAPTVVVVTPPAPAVAVADQIPIAATTPAVELTAQERYDAAIWR